MRMRNCEALFCSRQGFLSSERAINNSSIHLSSIVLGTSMAQSDTNLLTLFSKKRNIYLSIRCSFDIVATAYCIRGITKHIQIVMGMGE
jgi:hypothetical protein